MTLHKYRIVDKNLKIINNLPLIDQFHSRALARDELQWSQECTINDIARNPGI